MLERVQLNSNLDAVFNVLGIYVVIANQELNCCGEVVLLHVDDFLYVFFGRKDARELSLRQNVVNSLSAHGVKETNSGIVKVHVGDVGHQPLGSVFAPDTHELPVFAFTLSLSD